MNAHASLMCMLKYYGRQSLRKVIRKQSFVLKQGGLRVNSR